MGVLGYVDRKRVKRGARLLDGDRPEWFRQMDVRTLNLNSADSCAVAQTYGDDPQCGSKSAWWYGVNQLQARYGVIRTFLIGFFPGRYGFSYGFVRSLFTYERRKRILDKLWSDEILARYDLAVERAEAACGAARAAVVASQRRLVPYPVVPEHEDAPIGVR